MTLLTTYKGPVYSVEQVKTRSQIIKAGLFCFPLVPGTKRPTSDAVDWQKKSNPEGTQYTDIPFAFGMALDETYLVIDSDPRNFTPGDDPLRRLFDAGNVDRGQFKTLVVKTPSGGSHMYLRKPRDIKLRKNISQYKGLDFLSKGSYVVGPTSEVEGVGTYSILTGDVETIQDCPKDLLDYLITLSGESSYPVTKGGTAPVEYDDNERSKQKYIQFLLKAEPAFQGNSGDAVTFKIATVGRDIGLSPESNYFLMLEHYNPRCIPEWEAHELKTKVNNVYEYARGVLGESNTISKFEGVELPKETYDLTKILADAKWDFLPTKNGVAGLVRPNSKYNIYCYLSMKDLGDKPNPLYRIFGYNKFSCNFEFCFRPPFHTDENHHKAVTDNDLLELADWLYTNFNYRAESATILEGIKMFALKTNQYNPVLFYLGALKWDKVKRLENMLTRYLGVEDNIYSRAVSRAFMVGAVARAHQPGVQFDHMLVLEGPQGIGKSTFCRILGKTEWHAEIHLDPHKKDTMSNVQGVWIVEASEMEFTRKTEVMAIKAFLTCTKDRFRKPYSTIAEDYPRQCVFIGTINPEADGGYFKDTTGNRRFWPVLCRQLDRDALLEDIDQLWAEAVHEYILRTPIYLVDEEVQKRASHEQNKRTHRDPWVDIVAQWVELHETKGTPIIETDPIYVTMHVLSIPARDVNRAITNRVASLLAFSMKWKKVKNPEGDTKYINPKYYDEDMW